MRKLRGSIRTAAFLWFVVVSLSGSQAFAIEAGKPAPAYDIHLMNGQSFTPREGAGKVVVLHFWASWCVPCRSEMPAVERFYRQHHDEGLELVAISVDDPADMGKVNEVMNQYSFPGGTITGSNVKGYGRIWRIPLTFVIDRTGVLRLDAWDGGEGGITLTSLDQALSPLLQQKPPR